MSASKQTSAIFFICCALLQHIYSMPLQVLLQFHYYFLFFSARRSPGLSLQRVAGHFQLRNLQQHLNRFHFRLIPHTLLPITFQGADLHHSIANGEIYYVLARIHQAVNIVHRQLVDSVVWLTVSDRSKCPVHWLLNP